MMAILSAIAASVCLVVLLLLVSGSFVTNDQRIDVPKPIEFADEEESERPASKVTTQDAFTASNPRLRNCDLVVVIFQGAGGGAGPICTID